MDLDADDVIAALRDFLTLSDDDIADTRRVLTDRAEQEDALSL